LLDDGTPAVGAFEGWPAHAAEATVMDPCMGSGHFLVAAADMLRKMRMEEEGLTASAAAEAVLRDNLYGLELDPRCTQLGAFALAFDAWKAAAGYRPLPVPNIACSGIAVKGQLDDWRRLAGSDSELRAALDRLYELFQDAPELGSLIDPRSAAGEGLWAVNPEKLLATLDQALSRETVDPAAEVFGAAAQGTAKAARLLTGRYSLVATNPPFLGRRHQSERLLSFADAQAAEAKNDLATMVLWRALPLTASAGALAFVTPQAWTTLASSRGFRDLLLSRLGLRGLARLGPGAFQEISGEVVKVCLFLAVVGSPPSRFFGLDCSDARTGSAKADCLRDEALLELDGADIVSDPDKKLVFSAAHLQDQLEKYAVAYKGLTTGDDPQFRRLFWESPDLLSNAELFQSGSDKPGLVGGCSNVLLSGRLTANPPGGYRPMSAAPLEHAGVAVGHVGAFRTALYQGTRFDQSVAVLVPRTPEHLPPIFAFAMSGDFEKRVREQDSSIKVTEGTLTKVAFDVEYWTRVASVQYPEGLPKPQTDDPTQWLFKGNIVGTDAPLQVAVARLLGYRWPDQESDELDAFADPDGIVCLPPVSGEAPAAERLEKLLDAAYGADWSAAKRGELLAATGGKATTLDAWLRDEFFEQHARQFHSRPFIWHVWDGRRDGFSALLHYHRLDRATLEKLTYSQLGDWLERQRAGIAAGETGAEARLAAATELQRALANILEGEPPYDIYVRWKSLAEQPIVWEPDLDDGVRLNVRPFVAANILRAKFTINWNKDRGNDPDGSERLNDLHFTVAQKRAARQ
jgi:hypothetical protein